MAKKKGGLPKSIIKKYGITKEAWRVFRGSNPRKTTNKKVIRGKRTGTKRTTMARRRYAKKRKRSPNYSRKMDSAFRAIVRIAPHAMAHTGVAGIGYDVVEPAKSGDYGGAVKNFFTNEVLLHTGYDAIAGNFNVKPLAVNILAQIDVVGQLKRLVNRFTKIF